MTMPNMRIIKTTNAQVAHRKHLTQDFPSY